VSAELAAADEASPTERLKSFKERHHLAFEVAFFFAGFLFDVLLLHRIDSVPLLAHQGTYLVLSAALIFWDHRLSVAQQSPLGKQPTGWVAKAAGYRLWVMHFFLGTLLNAFMVFYFRAASSLSAFAFLVALAGIIVLNELPQFRSKGPIVRVVLLSFAVTSYLAYLIPVIWHELRPWQYVVAVLGGSAATFGFWLLFNRFAKDPTWTFARGVAPGLTLQATLLVLYLVGVIPPVPLSLKHIGIYSKVTRNPAGAKSTYTLEFQPAPVWQPWRREHAEFVADAGVEVNAFVRVFAPTDFRDGIGFLWEFDDPDKGWTPRGAPWFDKGFRSGGEKGWATWGSHHLTKPGDYRVRIMTEDGREIGRKGFTFVEGAAPSPSSEEE
jgi:hypothetical protein